MANYFNKNLKYLRENKGLSQNKLAENVGVNQTTIARWESKEMAPSIDNVEDVANFFNVPLPELLGIDLTISNNYNNAIDKNITQLYKDKDTEISVLMDSNIDDLPDSVKADIIKQALEEKQKMILEETEQMLNLKKELDNIEKKTNQ